MINYREMVLSDGDDLRELFKASPDTGIVTLYTHFPINPYDSLMMTRLENLGIVAEDSQTGIIGAGVASFGRFQYESQLRSYAFLHKIVVHPNHRRHGIATGLIQQLIDCTKDKIGEDGIVFGGIQTDNKASLAMAKKLGFQLTGEFHGNFVRTSSASPAKMPGISFRVAQQAELETFVQKLNNFYDHYNLYPIETIESLRLWLEQRPSDTPYRHCYVAVDRENRLLAGLTLSEDYQTSEIRFSHVPLPLLFLNKFLHIVPEDGVMRQVAINRLWFDEGHMETARCLWEQIRFKMHGRGNTLLLYYDPRGPLSELLQLPFYMPKGKLTLMIRGPALTEKTLIYPPA